MRKILIFILCLCTLFLCFVIPSFADEGVTTRAVPTNLTGVTVTVPAGWTASAGYGQYNVSCSFNDTFGDQFYIGYHDAEGVGVVSPTSNRVGIYDSYGLPVYSFTPSSELVITFNGGNDVGSSSLIQWFVDNDATFSGGSAQTFTIDAGYWTPSGTPTATNDYVLAIGVGNTLIYEMPALNGWVNAEGFTTYIDNVRFTLVSTNRTGSAYHLEVGYHDGYEYVRLYTIHKASSGTFTLTVDNQFRYFYFNDSFEVDDVGNALINGFFTYGTTEPDVDPPVPDIENFLTMFLNGVVSALDVDIFGYFSILDLIKVLVGACFIVWLLKMLAGG